MKIALVAASGLAREAIATLRLAGQYGDFCFLDDDVALVGTSRSGVEVVGGVDAVVDLGDHDVLVCAGRGAARRRLVARLDALGVGRDRYPTVIHPDAVVPDGCRVGAGSIVLAGAVLTADVTLGSHVVVMPQVALTHDDVVEDFATLCAGVALGGEVRVGEAAYVGMNASVRERVRLGADSILGMGAALLADLPAGETWAGVPARPLPSATSGSA